MTMTMTMTMTAITDTDIQPLTAELEAPPVSVVELELMIFTVCFEDKNKKKPYRNTQGVHKKKIFYSIALYRIFKICQCH